MVCNLKQNSLNLIKYIQFTTQDQIFKLKNMFEEFVKDIKEKEIKYDLAVITRLKDSSSIQLDENLVLNKEAFTDLKSLLIQKQINLECLEKVSDINYIQQVNQLFKKQFSKCKHLILDKGKINMYSLICDGNKIF
ncbi:hypothetical protein FGO68_gene15375 [Halteria grandinella]|uniref:Uncharacterized protein n=1 Tax=Halteria grandinella TaxID=5974 RepID=A0A8J8NMM7_HALGN|nr:hypothetical protein FGO68_gene15375 [Halteria grandinella]